MILSLCLAAQHLPLANALSNPLIPILIVFGIFYMLVMRPQAKERKEREQKIQALAKNTKVVTNAGIHGTVMSSDEDTVTLRVDQKNDIRMKFSKAAIWQVLDGTEKGAKADKDAKSEKGARSEKGA